MPLLPGRASPHKPHMVCCLFLVCSWSAHLKLEVMSLFLPLWVADRLQCTKKNHAQKVNSLERHQDTLLCTVEWSLSMEQVLPQAIKWLLISITSAVSSPVFVEVIDRASHYWFCLNSISWTDMWDTLWSYRANAVSITAVLASGCFVWYGGACLSERTRQYLHLAPTPACLSKT